jgi:hypothetical protein
MWRRRSLRDSIANAHGDTDQLPTEYVQPIDRLRAELRWLPRSPQSAKWLRKPVGGEGGTRDRTDGFGSCCGSTKRPSGLALDAR